VPELAIVIAGRLALINRREFLAGATAAAGALALQNKVANAATPKRPNLVYVFADELRFTSCGYNGDEYARTPNIDKLAAQGCNFNQAISSTPVCAPYRCSLMTGKYQSSTGMVINELRLSPEHECFGNALTKAGYHTGYIGKWHMWANQLGHHDLIKNGFIPPGPYRLGFDGLWAAYNFNHIYHHSPYFLNDATPHIRKQYEPDAQTDTAISFIKSAGTGADPFALFLSWGPPHDPWGWDNAEPQYEDLYRRINLPRPPNYSTVSDPHGDAWQRLPANYDQKVDDWRRVYYAQTANIDWNLGRLMQAVDDAGLTDNTIFVFTTDHGEMFGAHGRMGKYIFYEEAARIPFLMRWPKAIPAKTVSEALLGTPDIMPTILSMLDIPIPKTVEGIDMSSHAMGKGGTDHEAAHMQGMGATAAWTDGSEWRALRDHEYTYAIYHSDRQELLFNHRKDPFQMVNLAEDRSFATLLAHYRTMSENWRKEQNDTFEACSWYQDRWTKDRNITMTARGVGQNLGALHEITDKWFPDGVGDRSVNSRAPRGV
jgi:arylsulfatase A-like enzyme